MDIKNKIEKFLKEDNETEKKPYFYGNIEELTTNNENYRDVILTTEHSQLVLMSVAPGDEIGMEVHKGDQFIRFESGEGKCIIDGNEMMVSDGFAITVPAGAKHNVINVSLDKPLKLYAIYSPAEHTKGIVDKTKADQKEE